MLHAHALDAYQISVCHAHLLLAKTIDTVRHVTLMVYRSVKVGDADHLYAPIYEFIEMTKASLLHREIMEDSCMALGKAEYSLYQVWADPNPVLSLVSNTPKVSHGRGIHG